MLKNYWKLILLSLLIALFISSNVNAYVITDKPYITEIVLSEQNKIIHNGDCVHIAIRLSQNINKKYICVQLRPDGEYFSSENSLLNINCCYDINSNMYYGISEPFSNDYP